MDEIEYVICEYCETKVDIDDAQRCRYDDWGAECWGCNDCLDEEYQYWLTLYLEEKGKASLNE